MPQAEGVLITGVYGSGKSSVPAEIAYLLEQHGERFALRLAVPLAVIEQRLASDVTSGRRNDLREAAEQIATAIQRARPVTESGVWRDRAPLSDTRPEPNAADDATPRRSP